MNKIEMNKVAPADVAAPGIGGQASPDRVRIAVDGLGVGVVGWVQGDIPLLFIERRATAMNTAEEFLTWASASRAELDRLILEYGGILLRGVPIATATRFNEFIGVFPNYQPGYVGGGSPRNAIEGKVLESTRYDETLKIPLHSEMAYMKSYPARIAFFCRHAASVGGETIIGSMRTFMQHLPAALRDKLEQHQIHIVRNFAPAGTTPTIVDDSDKVCWNDAFYTDDRAKVEEHCKELGVEPIWNEDGSLTILNVMTPFTDHPVTGERFYRSHIHSNGRVSLSEAKSDGNVKRRRPSGYSLDNGEMLAPEEIGVIKSLFEKIERSFSWNHGDIMILDNLQVAHGRNPFSGAREVMVALLD
jgi:alpha-ketoglutarate-dependent taurine dioxygenase